MSVYLFQSNKGVKKLKKKQNANLRSKTSDTCTNIFIQCPIFDLLFRKKNSNRINQHKKINKRMKQIVNENRKKRLYFRGL